MEAAGFAVGIITLIGSFKDCIDLFSYFTVARSLGRDYEILSTKMDVEKALLLQWCQRTNLLQPNYDKRLDDPKIQATVAQIVSSIRILLSDTKTLQERYGMGESKPGDEALFGMSASRMSTFTKGFGKLDSLLRDFEKLDLRIRSHRAAPCTLKARWAIRDRDRFGDLLKELSYFVSRLHRIIPDTNNMSQALTERDIQSLSNRKTVRLLLEAVSGRDDVLAAVTEKHHTQICQGRILRCLRYRLMDDRRDGLSPPNPQTFEWALDPSATNLKWDNLAHWLSHVSKIYWICGKGRQHPKDHCKPMLTILAGSGKSTLMKYIYSHPKTKELLEIWAGETPLTVASFFFSYLGAEIQKSHEGLSRALMFKILDSDRLLIPELLPSMWEDAYNSDASITAPSVAELRQAYEKMGQIQNQNRKFCIFVDGLDEYSGKPMDGVNYILDLARNCNVKIVVSSRPIQSCAQAFSRMPKLYLQDLTTSDIRTYIEQTIDSHPHMRILYGKDPRQIDDLRSNLIEKAYGVFLWVVLACRSVREGLDNFDRLPELRRRIDELPPELESLFQYMLNGIEGRYRDHACKIIRICFQNQLVSATQELFTLGLALVDDYELEIGKLPSVSSLAANETLATLLDHQREHDEKYRYCTILEGRRRSHCLGLVEIKKAGSNHNGSCFCGDRAGGTDSHDEIIDSTVEFMHRTVFDFFSARGTAEINHRLEDRETFDPSPVLSCISLHLVGLTLHRPEGARHVKDSLVHIANTSIDRCSQVELILVRLHELLVGPGILNANSGGSVHIYGSVDARGMADLKASKLHLALFLAVEFGITGLLELYERMGWCKLSDVSLQMPLLCRVFKLPFTKTGIRGGLNGAGEGIDEYNDIVRHMIERGCSPNESFLGSDGEETNPWEQLLHTHLHMIEMGCPNAYLSSMINMFLERVVDLDYAAEIFAGERKTFKRDHFLRKLADHKAKSSSSLSSVDERSAMSTTRANSTLEQQRRQQQQQEIRLIPQLRTSLKRARSLSPPRLDGSKFSKLSNSDG